MGIEVRLRSKLYDKRYDFHFPIVNYPRIAFHRYSSNRPVDNWHISQLNTIFCVSRFWTF